CPVEYSRCTRSTSSIVFGMVMRRSMSDSRRSNAMGNGKSRKDRYLIKLQSGPMRVAALALAFFLPLAGAQTAPAPDAKASRLALVIGNGAYRDAPLPNPINDAADVAKALEASGFTVIRRENASLREMHLALREFGDKLGRQATGLFYFAGHGLQVRGRNYLLPVDADVAREDEVAFAAL